MKQQHHVKKKSPTIKKNITPAHPSSSPLAYRQQHGELKEYRDKNDGVRRFRALSPLESLHQRGRIDDEQMAAGQRFADSYALGIEGARNGEGSGAWEPAGMADARLAAATDYKKAINALGHLHQGIICDLALAGISLSRWAVLKKLHYNVALQLTQEGLSRLHHHYNKNRCPHLVAMARMATV
ncbi:MAG: hypothetical protein ACOYK8_01470 [Alphaproteobacteria bacterium]